MHLLLGRFHFDHAYYERIFSGAGGTLIVSTLYGRQVDVSYRTGDVQTSDIVLTPYRRRPSHVGAAANGPMSNQITLGEPTD